MPVHRHMHRAQGSVYAYRSELDAWRRQDERSVPRVPAAAPRQSIAVLPFGFAGPDPAQVYLANGCTDEIIATLSGLEDLRVTSRTSSMALKGSRKPAKTIARELDVAWLVEGTVRTAATGLRVSVRLIDPETDDRVWADSFDGAIEDVFEIQARIARDIAQALELRLTGAERRRLDQRNVDSIVAWECIVQARQASMRWRRDAIDEAVRLLENGLAVVGDNAALYAALGRAHLQYREAGIDPGDGPLARAIDCAGKVAALDPDSAAGLQLRGWIDYARGDIAAAVGSLRLALARDWSNADSLALIANCYLVSGRVDAARPFIERLLAVDPLTPVHRCLPGWASVLEGDFEAALAPYRTMYDMDPGNPLAALFWTWILALNGRHQDVLAVAGAFPAGTAAEAPAFIARLFSVAVHAPASLEGTEIPANVLRLAAASDMYPRLLAEAFALGGASSSALRWLETAVDRGFIAYPYLAEHHPKFSRMAGEPAYDRLIATVRERWQAFAD